VAPSKRASGWPAAIATASQAATSIAESAIRTIPVTPISLKRRASLSHRSTGATFAPATIAAAVSTMRSTTGTRSREKQNR
jgi:hypothetical protein